VISKVGMMHIKLYLENPKKDEILWEKKEWMQ